MCRGQQSLNPQMAFFLGVQILDMEYYKISRIINIDIRTLPNKIQIDVSKINCFTDQSINFWCARYRAGCKMRPRSHDVTYFNGSKLAIYI